MQISKWGNSLAVRLPAQLIKELGLKEGDEITLNGDKADLVIQRRQRSEEILADLRRYRGSLEKDERLTREAANER